MTDYTIEREFDHEPTFISPKTTQDSAHLLTIPGEHWRVAETLAALLNNKNPINPPVLGKNFVVQHEYDDEPSFIVVAGDDDEADISIEVAPGNHTLAERLAAFLNTL